MKKNYKLRSRIALIAAVFTMAFNASAQTTLINPATDGGFENGSTFSANGWSSSNSANNPWVIGTAVSSGAITGNSAYISNDAGVTNAYTPANNSTNYFWRDITVPAGEAKIILTFNWRSEGEASWDNMQVFTAPTTITPVGVATHPGSGTTNVPAGIAGATNIGFYQMGGAATVNSASIQLSPSLAGTTFRLIFSWKNETGGAQPPASIDNISLTSSLPGNFISITTGNWSAPATWQANAVPTSADNVIISSGDIVTLDLAGQAAYNATVNGTLNFGTVPTVFTVNQNLIVNTGGTLNAFNGTTGKNLTVTGNITNDGTIDLSKGTSTTTSVLTLNGSAVQTVSGTGTFTTNVIRNLTFNNSSNAIPNINWLFNNISIAANLTFTSGKVNLSTNKITLGTGTTSGTGANSVGALTAPVGQGFMPGGTFSRWYTTASTGTSITAGTDPTNATSRYPFLNSAAQNRAMYITRAASGTAGGQLSVKYNDGTGMSPVSFMDGTYNIDKIYNGNWVVSTEGTGITSASYGAYLIGQAAYTAANGNSRIVSNTAAISGTNQLGTTTPAGYRTGISLADLTNPSGLYLGISNADLLFPCAGTPTAGTVSGTATVCAGAPFTLSLTGASSGETGLTYQWQSSADGMTYSNIAGATTTSYTAPLIIAPTYYQVVVTCTNSSSSATTPSFLVGFTHSVTSISPASRCGTGAVTLGATGSAGTNLVWYSASAGGSYLGTGSTFTTPVINATTSYYVGAGTVSTGTASLGNGGTTGTSAAYNFTNGTYGGMKTQLLYTAAELTLAGIAPGNITTIAFDFTSVGSTLNGFNIQMGSSSLTTFGTPVNIVGGLSTVYTAATMTPVIGTNSFTLSTPFNWDGSSNILVSISWSNNNASNTSSTIKYDATTNYSSQSYRKDNETAVNMLGFTGSTGAGTSTFDRSTNRPRITFGAQIQCTSPLSEVVATVNTPPSLTMSATPSTICAGESSSLNVSSSNGGYAYTWTPGGLSGATHSVTPASTTTYTVTAMDNSGGANDGCATTATVTVNVNPLPTPPVTATPSVICSGGSSQLLAGSVPSAYCTPAMATVEAGGDFLNNFTFANITNLNSGDAATDYTYYNSLTANVLGGSTYSLSLEAGGTASLYAQQFRIWIDYNQNGVFEASESVFNTSTSSFSPTVVSGSVVIPMSAYNGITRMRVASRYSTTPLVSESCLGAGTYGEFEDYNVNISGGRDLPTYSWSPGTFLSSTTIQNPLASAMTATTTYTVNVTEGVCSASQTVTVTVNPLPTVTAASNDTDNTVCAGTSLTLNGGGASTYTWTGSVVNNTAFNPVSSNTYTVTGTDVNNCSSTASITVSVNSLPSVMAMSTASTVCAGTSVTLSGMGSATSYTWDNGVTDGVAFTPTGTTTYIVTGTDANNCSATSSTTVTVNSLPSVMAMSTASTVCAGTSVTLSGMGSATSYTWDNGVTDGVAFTPTGTTTYIVTGTDANNCSATSSTTVTVNSLPSVMAMSTASTVCAGTSVTLSGMGSATSYTWDNGVTDGVAFTPTGTTTYIVTGTDANNCSATSSTTVTVNSLPSVMAMSTASTVCAGTSVTLSGMGSATSYTWDNGVTDGVAFTPTGTITYIVTGTDANNCSATSSTTVTVNSLPSVMGMSNDMDNAICIGSSVMLSGMGAVSYTWTGGVTNGVSFTPTATDTYTVTGTDANNCMNTNTVTITVNSLPTVTGMSDDSDNTICAGSMITLSGMGAASYTWTGGVSDAVSFAPAATDTYTVTGTDASGCMNTNTITVTVNALPAVTMSAFGTSVCDNGGPVSLGGGSPAGGMYSGTGVSGNTFDPTGLSGMYLITYTVTDANSCSNSDTASIMVDLCSGITSIKGSSTVKVYPNPANGMVTVSIEGSNSEQITISIVDIQGKQIFNEINKNVTSEFNKQINIEGLAKGAYYIKVTSDNKTEIHKLIVH